MNLSSLDNIFLTAEGEGLIAEARMMIACLESSFELIAESPAVSGLISKAKEVFKKIIGYVIKVVKNIIEFFTGKKSSGGGGGGGSAIYQAASLLMPSQIKNLTDLVMTDNGGNGKAKNIAKEAVSNLVVNNTTTSNNNNTFVINEAVYKAIGELYAKGDDVANKSLTKIATGKALNDVEDSNTDRVIKDGMDAFIESVKAKHGTEMRKVIYEDMIARAKDVIFVPRLKGVTSQGEYNKINSFIKNELVQCIYLSVEKTIEAFTSGDRAVPAPVMKFSEVQNYNPIGTTYLSESFIKGQTAVQPANKYNLDSLKGVEDFLNGFYKNGSVENAGIEMLFTKPDNNYNVNLKNHKNAFSVILALIPTEIVEYNIDNTTAKQLSFDSELKKLGVEKTDIEELSKVEPLLKELLTKYTEAIGPKREMHEGTDADTQRDLMISSTHNIITMLNAVMSLSTMFTTLGPKYLEYIKMVSTYNTTVEANIDLMIGQEFIRRVRAVRAQDNKNK